MDSNIKILFDGKEVLYFVQGEDRTVQVVAIDMNTGLPINLTGGVFGINFPLQGGGSIKRTTLGPLIQSSDVVIPSGMVPNGYIKLTDHGLVTGDPIQAAVVSGGLPAPLAASTNYLVRTIDNNSFYITDTAGVIISLTTQGTGSFNLVNSNDIQIATGDLGKVTLNLRAPVSQVVNAYCAQDFQVLIDLSSELRIKVLKNLLDCVFQPVM